MLSTRRMAFITLRRSRNTLSYYLVESYRDDQGRSRKRTLCYLGREQDGTDTLEKALTHWQRFKKQPTATWLPPMASGGVSCATDRRNRRTHRPLRRYIEETARVEAERRKRQQAEAEAHRRLVEEAEHWQAIERLQRHPSAEHAQAAKRAYRILSLRLHPDQGGSHEAFIRFKAAYERAGRSLAGEIKLALSLQSQPLRASRQHRRLRWCIVGDLDPRESGHARGRAANRP